MQPKSELTRQKILNAAIELFRRRGFAEATMREIAVEAGVAAGLSYYYFPSKEELVMAFYQKAKDELEPALQSVHEARGAIEDRLRGILNAKFAYFLPNRRFLGALLGHSADPHNPMSPFSEATRAIREHDFTQFERAIEETGTTAPKDLAPYMARILWMFHMGILMFWIYDRSDNQQRTQLLLDKSLRIVSILIRAAKLPFMRPARKMVVDVVRILSGEEVAA